MTQRCDDINKFWKGVHKAVVDSGVAEPMPIWYVNWTQKFAASFRGKPLQSCSAEDVCRFLDFMFKHGLYAIDVLKKNLQVTKN